MRGFLSLLVLAALLAGCSDKPKVNAAEDYLGAAQYARLAPDPALDGMLVWRSPDYDPRRYRGIVVENVEVARPEEIAARNKVAPEDLTALSFYLRQVVDKAVQGYGPRPGTPERQIARLKFVITDVAPTNPVMNTVSSVTPVGLLMSLGTRAATGEFNWVGGCSVAGFLTDSGTGERMVVFAAQKTGDKYSLDNFSELGQTRANFDAWAALVRTRLEQLAPSIRAQ